jgi:hypothetical protein
MQTVKSAILDDIGIKTIPIRYIRCDIDDFADAMPDTILQYCFAPKQYKYIRCGWHTYIHDTTYNRLYVFAAKYGKYVWVKEIML